MLNKQSGIAVYRQIADILILRIKLGIYEPGERLPSDRSLSEEFGHNRHTVRRALDILATEKLIMRQQGKGTFVAKKLPHFETQTSLPLGLIDLAKEIGVRPQARLLHSVTRTAEQLGDLFDIPASNLIYYIHRLRLIDAEPVIIEYIHIPQKLAPQLLSDNLESSLSELMQAKYRIKVDHLDIVIQSIVSDASVSKLLQIPVGSPLILEKRTAYTQDEYVCEYSEHIYRGDRFKFTQQYYNTYPGKG